MRRITLFCSFAVLLSILVVGIAPTASGSSGRSPEKPNVLVLEPRVYPEQPGPVDLILRFAPPDSYTGDDKFQVSVFTSSAGVYSGPTEWEIEASPSKPYERVLSMVIEPDTISALVVAFEGKGYHIDANAWFVHRGDSVEFWKGHPGAPRGKRERSRMPQMSDSLNFSVTMMSPEQVRQTLEILGQLPDSALGRAVAVKSTLGNMFALSHLGIKVVNLDVYRGDDPGEYRGGSWIQRRDSGDERRTNGGQPKRDSSTSSAPQGSTDGGERQYVSQVVLDTVIPLVDASTVQAANGVEFRFRLENGESEPINGITNGLRIYSDDGATWDNSSGTWEDVADDWFDVSEVNEFGPDPFAPDTLGFGALRIFDSGLPADSSAWAWTVTLDLAHPSNVGKTICIDKSWFPPQGDWLWSPASGGAFAPGWDGPHCYQIMGNTDIVLEGNLWFYDYSYNQDSSCQTCYQDLRRVLVEVWDAGRGGPPPGWVSRGGYVEPIRR